MYTVETFDHKWLRELGVPAELLRRAEYGLFHGGDAENAQRIFSYLIDNSYLQVTFFNWARRRKISDDEAWDLWQETWIRIWKTAPKFLLPSLFWKVVEQVHGRRQSQVADRHRQEISVETPLVGSDEVIGTVGDLIAAPRDVASENETFHRLAKVHLGPESAEASLYAKYFEEGLSSAEIAEIEGLPPGTTASKIYRMKAKLSAWLVERNPVIAERNKSRNKKRQAK